MVTCDNCGKKISYETLRCPDCKAINSIAEEHYKELAIYDKKYEKALYSVYKQTAEYKEYMLKFAVTGILVFTAFFAVLFSKSPKDVINQVFIAHGDYAAEQNAAKDSCLAQKNYSAYAAIELQNGKYMPSYHDHDVMDTLVTNYMRVRQGIRFTSDSYKRYLKNGYTLGDPQNPYASSIDNINSGMSSFQKASQILEIYKNCYQEGKELDKEEIDAIWLAFSYSPLPSEESLALQVQAQQDLKVRLDALLMYNYAFSQEEVDALWEMDHADREYALLKQAREVYPYDGM